MKKFMLKLVAFALALTIPLGVWFLNDLRTPAMFGGSLMGSARIKLRLLDEVEGPRIILVGGSSLPYSVISEEVEEAFGMPCVNLGATAYLGMEFYTSMMRGRIHEGDVVVFMPEFSMYRNLYSYTTVWMAVENVPRSLLALPPQYIPGMVANYYNYRLERGAQLDANGVPEGDMYDAYYGFGFNYYGDITTKREQQIDEAYGRGDAYDVNPDMLEMGVVRSMNRFYRHATKQGAEVYLSWAPFCELGVRGSDADIAAFQAHLEDKCSIPYLGSIEDGFYPLEYFYDSNNHLNSEGQRVRTAALIETLSEVL